MGLQLLAGIIFGSIGFVAFVYGKKQTNFKIMIIGVLLMVYPYFISNDVAVLGVGVILSAALYFFRE